MMDENRVITVYEVAAVLICTIIGVGVLALPRVAADAAGTGAPLVTVMGTVLALFGVCVLACLGKRFPNQSIFTYGESIVGRWLGRIGSILLILFFAFLCALTVREFGEVVVSSILMRTPIQVTIIALLLLSAISARNDIVTFVYIQFYYLPFILAPGLVIVGLTLKNAHGIYLLPLLGNEPHVSHIFQGVFVIAALYQGSFILTILVPFMREPHKALKSGLWGIAISGGLYLSFVIVTIAVFGSVETRSIMFPTLDLAKFTSIPGEFLERLDGLFIIVWVIAVFTTVYSSYFLVVRSLSELFRYRDHRFFAFAILPFIFIIAVIPQNISQMYRIIKTAGGAGLLITIVYPMLLLIIAWIRRVKGDIRDEDYSKSNP